MPTTTIPRSSRWRCSRSRRSASCGALDRTRYAARESAACVRLRHDLRRTPGARDRRGGASDHCRVAWARGRFLARGSLSLAAGRTHLEFVVDADEAPVLVARLAELGLPARQRLRRGAGVITWKGTATVLRFLQLAGAGAALLELEARMVARELRAELNRQLNAETANLHRGIAAGARQLAAGAAPAARGA